MEIAGIGLTIIYGTALLWMFFRWQKFDKKIQSPLSGYPKELSISIIIPVRNEAAHIGQLLEDLIEQKGKEKIKIPISKLEVLVVDDNSEDNTFQVASSYIRKVPYNLRVIRNHPKDPLSKSFKKQAITTGIREANGKIILQTDGDCRIPIYWIWTYLKVFQVPGVKMAAGPVALIDQNSFLSDFQRLEQAALTGITGVTIDAGIPVMCNGANMGYYRQVFEKVNGFEGNMHIPSGDDEYLLKKVMARYPGSVRYLANVNALIATQAKSTWKAMFHQRKRWAAKWKSNKTLKELIPAVFIFTYHLQLVIATLATILGQYNLMIFFAQWSIKVFAEYLLLANVLEHQKQTMPVKNFLVIQLLYPIYTLIFGISSNWGTYKWKGRVFK